MSSTGATLSGSYTGATGTISDTGFYYWTSTEGMTKVSSGGTNTPFSKELTGLTPSKTYFYKAYVVEGGQEVVGAVKTFATTSRTIMDYKSGWLELPALRGDEDYFGYFYGSGGNTDANRNYSYNYSYARFASLWTAYQLKGLHKTGTASTNDWSYNPNIDPTYQVNMTGNSYPTMYNADNYSKGHQCPNASRKSNKQMNSQTYYCTNQTPQIQEGFNGSIWGELEKAVRDLVSNDDDVVYVVTGPTYRTVGGNETITYLDAASGQSNAYPAKVPVPNYYWKAILKVKWNGNQVTSASAIGFWFEHKQYSNNNYAAKACSVDFIEQMTGFDLFTNLPGDNNSGIEKTAELNTSWSDFQDF